MRNNITFKSVGDVFEHACAFLLRDVQEIAHIKRSEFIDIGKFTIHAYKKVFQELQTGLTTFYPNSKFKPLRDKLFFQDFNDIIDINSFNLTEKHKSILDIAKDMGSGDKFNNLAKIDTFYIDAITNLPSFIGGFTDFCVSCFSLDEDGNLKNVFIYNPTSREMLQYNSSTKLLFVNDRKAKTSNKTSIKLMNIGVIAKSAKDISNMPKMLNSVSMQHFSSNLPIQLVNLASNRVQLLVNFSIDDSDKLYIQLLKQAGYLVYHIRKNTEIDFLDESKRNDDLGYIVTTRGNYEVMK